ncbi:MAG: type II toxin-antitoxin system VapC family toxin [Streptosporangiales bacterium]
MRLLLDTHVILWWLGNAPRLASDLMTRLETEPETFVSAVSVWEVSIKQALGKLKERANLAGAISERGFRELPVTFRHAVAVRGVPPHHKDPFDRMLIAQARAENLTIVTHDRRFESYDVPLLLA